MPKTDDGVDSKILTGLSRLSVALRSDYWGRSFKEDLNPTQLQVLTYMLSLDEAPTVGELARQLGVTKATLSDTVKSLCEKNLARRVASQKDRRSANVHLTSAGRKLAARLGGWSGGLLAATRLLTKEEKDQLLLLVSKMVLGLQEAGRIAPARLCLGCVYFRSNKHPGSQKPHHCDFVDAPLGDGDLRLNCSDFSARAEK